MVILTREPIGREKKISDWNTLLENNLKKYGRHKITNIIDVYNNSVFRYQLHLDGSPSKDAQAYWSDGIFSQMFVQELEEAGFDFYADNIHLQ